MREVMTHTQLCGMYLKGGDADASGHPCEDMQHPQFFAECCDFIRQERKEVSRLLTPDGSGFVA